MATSVGLMPVTGRYVANAWAAAAIGLVVFFAGALASHMRAHAFHNIGVPSAYLALAISSMALAATVD